jgi:4-hydroxymandelate oxidase
LATLSTTSIEDAMAAATGPVWFQLYVFRDRAITASLVQRAEAAGCKAVVLTVDMPMQGKRERDVRNRFTLPDHLSLKNFSQAGFQELPKNVAGSGLAAYVASLLDAALTWKDIEWLAGVTKLPLLVKGILRADDALRAVNHGASRIIVSNHGARQLDTTRATISVLAEIVDAVAGAVEVYVDGGIRRGTDVLKAMAYGARPTRLPSASFPQELPQGQGFSHHVLILHNNLKKGRHALTQILLRALVSISSATQKLSCL